MSLPPVVVFRSPVLEPLGPAVFGDGLRCVGVPLVRLAIAPATSGVSTHVFGHGAMAPGGTFYYQLAFRNSPAMFCTPEALNMSNGRVLVW
jgi:hypothetical protein